MSINFTDEQKQKLLEEARKVRQPDMTFLECQEALQYLVLVAMGYWKDWIDFYLVKDNNGKKHIRCCYGDKETIVLDNAVEKFGCDNPEWLVYIIECMFSNLTERENGK